MSITTDGIPAAHLRRIKSLDAAGTSAAAIAEVLIAEGIPVPRESSNTHHLHLRYPHGYALATHPSNPGRWTGAAVTELLAIAAVANDTLGGGATHVLTVP